jgi:hypothetical protein
LLTERRLQMALADNARLKKAVIRLTTDAAPKTSRIGL